jgi:hypothetical protein
LRTDGKGVASSSAGFQATAVRCGRMSERMPRIAVDGSSNCRQIVSVGPNAARCGWIRSAWLPSWAWK